MNPGINILFYSRDCETCKNLLKILQNENLLSFFKLFCVDDKLNMVPPQITVVPTMIIANLNKPLVAQETFEWITRVKFMRQQQMMDVNKRIIQQNIINLANNNKNGPISFIPQEMTGITDTFAYKDIDKPQPHSFFNIGEEDKHAIFTAPEPAKMSKDEQNKMIKELEVKRDTQSKEYEALMKQQQMQAILKAEQEKNNTYNYNT